MNRSGVERIYGILGLACALLAGIGALDAAGLPIEQVGSGLSTQVQHPGKSGIRIALRTWP